MIGPAPALLCGMASAVLVLAALASGDVAPLHVRYEAPPGCPDEQAFYGAVQSRTARVRVAPEAEATYVFHVRITRDPAGSVGELRTVRDGREGAGRRVEGSTCEEVMQALALTVALSVDPSASIVAAPSASAPPLPSASSKPVPLPPPRPVRPPPPAAPLAPSWTFEVGVEGLVAEQVDPFVSAGGALVGGIAQTREGLWAPSVDIAIGQLRNDVFSTPSDAAVTLTLASVTACPVHWPFWQASDVRFCAVGQGGSMVARGREVLRPRSIGRAWFGVGPAAQARLVLFSRFVVKLDIALMVPFAPRQFVIDEPPRVVAETPAFSPFAGIGVSVRP
jgi:hypothetical protein